MRVRSVAIGAALALALLVPASASAKAPVQVYHGVFTGATIFGCGVGESTFDMPLDGASGVWNVTINGDKAWVQASVFGNFGDGLVHIDAFGGVKHGVWGLVDAAGTDTFHVRIPSDVFGTQDDFILVDGQLDFRLTPYPIFGPDGSLVMMCDHASTFGELR